MITLENITKKFKSDFLKNEFIALDDVSFEINKGELIGFLGANGAGKTTSIKVILNFINPTSGKVIYDGNVKNPFYKFSKKIGFLPERPYFYPHLTGRSYARYMADIVGVKKSTFLIEIKDLSRIFGIDFALDREIHTYSKGMLQRLGFLTAILHRPELIILDEPLAGVDPVGRKELKEIMKNVFNRGTSIFFSSHIVSDMQEICDKVVFLEKGKLVFNESVSSLINRYSENKTLIRYLDFKEVKEIVIDSDECNQMILDLINKKNKILKVQEIKPSLEEIIYNVY